MPNMKRHGNLSPGASLALASLALLVDFAYETARQGYPWKKYPPFFEPESVFRTQ